MGWKSPSKDGDTVQSSIEVVPVPETIRTPSDLSSRTDVSSYLVYTKPGCDNLASLILNEISRDPCDVNELNVFTVRCSGTELGALLSEPSTSEWLRAIENNLRLPNENIRGNLG